MRLVLVFALILLLPLGAVSAHHLVPDSNLLPDSFKIQQAAQFNFSSSNATVQTDRGTLIEVSTATWCGPCYSSEMSIQRMLENLSREDVMLLSYHPDDGQDPYGTPFHNALFYDYYNLAPGFPSVVFGGGYTHDSGGVETDMYVLGSPVTIDYEYDIRRQTDQARPSNFTMTLNGSVASDTAVIEVEVANTEPFVGYHEGDLVLHVVLFEDNLFFDGGNGITDHRYTVRDAATNETLDFSNLTSYARTISFDLDPTWNQSNLGVIAYLQMDPSFVPDAGVDEEEGRADPGSWFVSNWILLLAGGLVLVLLVNGIWARLGSRDAD